MTRWVPSMASIADASPTNGIACNPSGMDLDDDGAGAGAAGSSPNAGWWTDWTGAKSLTVEDMEDMPYNDEFPLHTRTEIAGPPHKNRRAQDSISLSHTNIGGTVLSGHQAGDDEYPGSPQLLMRPGGRVLPRRARSTV